MPTLPPQPLNLNIPDPLLASDTDLNFKKVADDFAQSVDLKHQPCDSFYEYTCGKIGYQQTNVQRINLEVASLVSDEIDDLLGWKILLEQALSFC